MVYWKIWRAKTLERDIEMIKRNLDFYHSSDIKPYAKYNASGSKLWNIKRMHPLNKRRCSMFDMFKEKCSGTYDFKLEMNYIGE